MPTRGQWVRFLAMVAREWTTDLSAAIASETRELAERERSKAPGAMEERVKKLEGQVKEIERWQGDVGQVLDILTDSPGHTGS